MARVHGKAVRAYLNGVDASAQIGAIDPKLKAATHDDTTFADAGWAHAVGGLKGWDVSLDGFVDPAHAAGGVFGDTAQLAGQATLSFYDGDADAAGETGGIFPGGMLTERGEPMNVAELVKRKASLKGTGSAGLPARLLHPKGTEAASGQSAGVDHGASTANGGIGALHVTAVAGGAATIKVQHSADGSTWADLITFAAAAAIGSEATAVTGTVNRHLRASHAPAGGGSVQYVLGFARF